MSGWGQGYVTDIPYLSGFYAETSPAHLAFLGLLLGVRTPMPGPGATYCELGCGQGFSLALLAAANPGMEFVGIDFNPAQIANARRFAAAAGLGNVRFLERSFADALDPADALPEFDYVVLHGIYSWVSAENRQAIVRFLARKLRSGGLAYVSYNAQPGWAARAPFQALIREQAARLQGRSDERVQAAFAFAARLVEADLGYVRDTPSVKRMFEHPAGPDSRYLAHEYLNDHWHALFVTEVARDMAEARLDYLGSATLIDNFDSLMMPDSGRALLPDRSDPVWRELLIDFISNKAFRRDVYGRGLNPLSAQERQRMLQGVRFALLAAPPGPPFVFDGPGVKVQADRELCRELVARLAGANLTVGELAEGIDGYSAEEVLQTVVLLCHGHWVLPVFDGVGGDGSAARGFNRAVVAETEAGRTSRFFALPAAGSGFVVSVTEQIAFDEVGRFGSASIDLDALALRCRDRLRAIDHTLTRDGQPVEDGQELLDLLRQQLEVFVAGRLPAWARLGLHP